VASLALFNGAVRGFRDRPGIRVATFGLAMCEIDPEAKQS